MISKTVEIDDWDLLLFEEKQKEDPLDFDFTRRLVGQGRQTNLKQLDNVHVPERDFRQDKESVRLDLGRVAFFPHQPKRSVRKIIPLGSMVLNKTIHFKDTELGGPGHYTGQLDSTGQAQGMGKAWFYSAYAGIPLGFYVGAWHEGLFTNRGFLKTAHAEYLGNFVEGKMHGIGKRTTTRERYIGNFNRGVMEGRGQLRTLEGTYTGELQNGKPHGYGKLVYSASKEASHEGFFCKGERHGYGIHTTPDVKRVGQDVKRVGQWRKGYFVPGSEE